MLIQKKPNSWSCMATAFSMVLGIPVSDFFAKLGHDGSQRLSDVPDPAGRRGIHVQECIYVAQMLGHSVTPVELMPQIQTYSGKTISVEYHADARVNLERFQNLIRTTSGVVTGFTKVFAHAMAFEHGHMFDPDHGSTFPYSREHCEQRGFYTQCLWIVT